MTEEIRLRSMPIVVGVDGTDTAREALAWAVSEAAIRGCEVHAVNVWEYDATRDFMLLTTADIRNESRKTLDAQVAKVTAGRDDLPRIVQKNINGTPVRSLCELSETAALLVVGKHRGGVLREAVMGSVSAGCLRHASCPVVVIPPGIGRRLPATDGASMASTKSN